MTEPVLDHSLLVDPELRSLLELLPAFELNAQTLPFMRDASRTAAWLSEAPGAADKVGTERRRIAGPPGAPEVGVQIHRPKDAAGPLPCILHIHGGGYVAGSAEGFAPALRAMVMALDCLIVSVDYRLAPETPFPGAVEDCYAALSWLHGEAQALGVDPARIGVMGESAGGGLAAALALLARDRGEHALAFQHLIYPMLDDRTCVDPGPHPHTGRFVWTPQHNRFGWRSLLGREPGGPDVSPYAAAARAVDLSRLPPTFISTGSLDLFLEEDMDYARRLSRAGVPVELHVYPGGFHAFDFIGAEAAVSRAARSASLDALRRALNRPAGPF